MGKDNFLCYGPLARRADLGFSLFFYDVGLLRGKSKEE